MAEETTLLSHLMELRSRLLRMVVVTLVIFACLTPFANELFSLLARPLLDALPESQTLIATQVASPLLTPFKLTLVVALFIAAPYILYQVWAFVAPGLYKKEKRFAFPLLISSVLLFYLGAAFAYFIVFPLAFGFFTRVTPDGVAVMTDINHYLNFVLSLFLAFGLAFEVPIATVLIVRTRLVTLKTLRKQRAYVFLGAFVVGMVLTPPDVVSQVLLALPVYVLYELGMVMAALMVPKPTSVENVELQDS